MEHHSALRVKWFFISAHGWEPLFATSQHAAERQQLSDGEAIPSNVGLDDEAE